MDTNKKKYAFWLTPEAKREIESSYTNDNCQSQSEFVEKAVRFYSGYLHAGRNAFLPSVLSDILEGSLGTIADRIGQLVFKLAVEMSMTMHIIAADTGVDPNLLEPLRTRCVNDVMRTNGQIRFKDILKFQKEP